MCLSAPATVEKLSLPSSICLRWCCESRACLMLLGMPTKTTCQYMCESPKEERRRRNKIEMEQGKHRHVWTILNRATTACRVSNGRRGQSSRTGTSAGTD
eukprot:765795-Hanusia_phi.AAC.2